MEPVLAAALLPWFFVTPIFLPVEDARDRDRAWLEDLLQWANPIAPFIEAVRDVLYAGVAPSVGHLAYLVGAGALACWRAVAVQAHGARPGGAAVSLAAPARWFSTTPPARSGSGATAGAP